MRHVWLKRFMIIRFFIAAAGSHYSTLNTLADRVHYFKEDEKGVAIMCKAMEDMRNEAAREAEKMKAIRMARLMIEDGKLSYEDIAMYTELTLEEAEKIALEKKSA